MKKIIVLLLLLTPFILFAQSVAINTDGTQADNTALLDIKSTTKGLLIPRMTSAERTAIPAPALGLTVFDINTISYWIYRGDLNNGWVEMVHSQQNYWTPTGIHIYNNNLGNVGIGTNTPASKLTINGIDPVIGLMNNGIATGSIQANGFDMKIGTHPDNPVGDIIFQPKGIDRVWITENGKVGVGTPTPTGILTVNGINPYIQMQNNGVDKGYLLTVGNDLKLAINSTNATGKLIFNTQQTDRMVVDDDGKVGIGTLNPYGNLTVNGASPFIQMQHNNANTGYIQAVNAQLRLGTNLANATGNLVLQTKEITRLAIDKDGLVGIGTTSPSTILTINGNEPILQMRNDDVNKGFVQLVGDDIKIGTNSSNDLGKFLVRTNGVDRFSIDHNGNAILGSSSEGGDLVLNGSSSKLELKSNGTSSLRIIASSINPIIEGTAGNGIFRIRNSAEGIVLHPTGHISLGGTVTGFGKTLSVNGAMIATSVTALAIINWPDYVFEQDYKLKPLSEVKQFIAENKHLPNIPPASEIEKSGVELGDMSKRLIEKIEELTLYILQQQDQIDELKKQIQKITLH